MTVQQAQQAIDAILARLAWAAEYHVFIPGLVPRETVRLRRRGWFADIDADAPASHQWQPCFETGEGHIPCFQIWFETRDQCERWIQENLLGVGMLPE